MKHKFIVFATLFLMAIGSLAAQTTNGLSLDGVNDYVGGYGDVYDMGTSDMTVSAWFKANSGLDSGGIVGKSSYRSNFGRWSIVFENDILKVMVQFVTGTAITHNVGVANAYNNNTWNNITVVFDRDAFLTVYMNGQYHSQVSISAYNGINMNNSDVFMIGRYQSVDGTGPHPTFGIFGGSIDDVRIWNVALDASTIANTYNTEITNLPQNGLVGYWNFNETEGTIANDLSGSGNHGTLINGPTWSSGAIVTLPVELSSFTATITSQYFVQLHWVTQSETDALGYMIYRSLDNDLEHAIQVSPLINATNTATQVNYEYTDAEVTPGTWYYWLQSLDLNGNFDFHGPVLATVTTEQGGDAPGITLSTGIANVYPNPFNPSLNIQYSLKVAQDVSIRIYNTRGQMVQSFELGNREAGVHNLSWDANGQATGIYLIRMQAGNKLYNSKAVLSK